jgi:ATP-dependent metalloprotease
VRLDDVKGIDEIKGEIQDLIKMIKNSSDYTSKGAKLFKGVLLSGAPGTGKTLLARAIAGESGVNFIYCTGSNFDEMFVGLGAKRVRELFETARKSTPCIIFIDEIDSLMSKSRRFGSEHSSSRGTIN